jgi:hypothetical protein
VSLFFSSSDYWRLKVLLVAGAAEVTITRRCLALFANSWPSSTVQQHLCARKRTTGAGFPPSRKIEICQPQSSVRRRPGVSLSRGGHPPALVCSLAHDQASPEKRRERSLDTNRRGSKAVLGFVDRRPKEYAQVNFGMSSSTYKRARVRVCGQRRFDFRVWLFCTSPRFKGAVSIAHCGSRFSSSSKLWG